MATTLAAGWSGYVAPRPVNNTVSMAEWALGSWRPDEIWRSKGMRYEQASTIVTFDSPLEAQVHRESAGAPMVLEFLRAQMDLRG